jgi:sugar (pentulose or hexulose) kinase
LIVYSFPQLLSQRTQPIEYSKTMEISDFGDLILTGELPSETTVVWEKMLLIVAWRTDDIVNVDFPVVGVSALSLES